MLPVLLITRAPEADRELIERLRRRDPQALGELYDRYGRVVYSLVLRVVRDTSVAEDLVQETFLRVWNRVHGFDANAARWGLGF
jgi:RNA polymerase sigma-70 factor (ECF subfamily)